MLSKTLFGFVLLSLAVCGLWGEQRTRLIYHADQPMELVCSHNVEVSQTIPGLDLSSQAEQILIATISIEKSNDATSPLSIILTPKSLHIDLAINQERAHLDSREPGTSLVMAEIGKLMGKPIRLTLDKNLALGVDQKGFVDILNDFPALKELELKVLLEELILPIFALSGTDLAVGTDVTLQNSFGVHYEVTEITDKQIKATIRGNLPPFKKLLGSVEAPDKKSVSPELTTSGTLQGYAEWDRENALNCHINCDYKFNGLLKLYEWEWPVSINLHVDMGTREIPTESNL